MKRLITLILLVFAAVIAASYFYFSALERNPRVTDLEAPEAGKVSVDTTGQENGSLADSKLRWAFELTARAVRQPSVHRTSDGGRFILIQDAYHILHAVSADGRKLWNAQLPGAILDSIVQLPDGSLVFTTATRLYRIDTEGDPLPGFSLRLPRRAVNGVQLADGNPDALRIDVPADNRILTYDGRGRLLKTASRSAAAKQAVTPDSTALKEEAPPSLQTACGPYSYYGPLTEEPRRFLVCAGNDRRLYCYAD